MSTPVRSSFKVCTHCKLPNHPQSVICKQCGSRLPGTATSSGAQTGHAPMSVPAPSPPIAQRWLEVLTDGGLCLWAVLCLFVPIAGWVLYFIHRRQNARRADVFRACALVGTILNAAYIGGMKQRKIPPKPDVPEPPPSMPDRNIYGDASGRFVNYSIMYWVAAKGKISVSYKDAQSADQTTRSENHWDLRQPSKLGQTLSLAAHNDETQSRIYVAIYINGMKMKTASCDGAGCTATCEYTIPQQGLSFSDAPAQPSTSPTSAP